MNQPTMTEEQRDRLDECDRRYARQWADLLLESGIPYMTPELAAYRSLRCVNYWRAIALLPPLEAPLNDD